MFAYKHEPQPLTSFVVVMLWISLAFEVLSLSSDFGEFSMLNREFTEAEATANDMRQGMIGLGQIAVFLTTAVAFLRWTYRANVNSRGFGAKDMQYTPGWSIGCYFIPFVNLFWPFQAMKEIWQVSLNPHDWQSQPGGALLGWWWGLWLLSGVTGQITLRLAMAADTVDMLRASTAASMVSGVVGILSCLVTVSLVKTIAQRQEELVDTEWTTSPADDEDVFL